MVHIFNIRKTDVKAMSVISGILTSKCNRMQMLNQQKTDNMNLKYQNLNYMMPYRRYMNMAVDML